MMTPSVSTPSVDQDDVDIDIQERARMSPSPEIELSPPEFDDDHPMLPQPPGESFSGRSSLSRDGTVEHHRMHRQNRAPSPPLEADEKGFTETAHAVRARGMSLNEPAIKVSIERTVEEQGGTIGPAEETMEMTHHRDQELGYELFGGQPHGTLGVPNTHILVTSSPTIQPRHHVPRHLSEDVMARENHVGLARENEDVEMAETSWGLSSPENVELDELDGLFSGF